MAIYDFECSKCKFVFELRLTVLERDGEQTCQRCGQPSKRVLGLSASARRPTAAASLKGGGSTTQGAWDLDSLPAIFLNDSGDDGPSSAILGGNFIEGFAVGVGATPNVKVKMLEGNEFRNVGVPFKRMSPPKR